MPLPSCLDKILDLDDAKSESFMSERVMVSGCFGRIAVVNVSALFIQYIRIITVQQLFINIELNNLSL